MENNLKAGRTTTSTVDRGVGEGGPVWTLDSGKGKLLTAPDSRQHAPALAVPTVPTTVVLVSGDKKGQRT